MAEELTIRTLDNGPYLVDGNIKVIDADGTAYEVKGTSIALCRCGHSANKPFCDGSHKREDFQSAPRAGQ